jgi:hypothetical protein
MSSPAEASFFSVDASLAPPKRLNVGAAGRRAVKTKPVNMMKFILVDDFSEGFVAPPKLNMPPDGA